MPSSQESRIGPAQPAPIVFEGKRYEEVANGQLLGLDQRTGLMAVYDNATNARLSVVEIYQPAHDPRVEEDAQDVFFTRFELDAGQREIVIENEARQRFIYRLDDGTVRPAP